MGRMILVVGILLVGLMFTGLSNAFHSDMRQAEAALPDFHWQENRKIRDCRENYAISDWVAKCGRFLN